MALFGTTTRKVRYLQLTAMSLVLGFSVTVRIEDPATSSSLHLVPAPIVIEASDPSINIDDPALIEELAGVHADFEAGQSQTVIGPITSDMPVAAAINTGMSVAYDATYLSPSNVQAVVGAAAADWDAAVASTPATPIKIAVIWKNLGNPNLLGSAGPNGLYSGGTLPFGVSYPAALANVLLGYDINGSDAELTVNLNSEANWYIGTSGAPGAGQIDLYSVILHEIGHGLGFIGSGSLYNDTPNTTPTLETTPFVFDRQVTYGGSPLLNHGSPDSLLRSQNLFINLSDTLSNKLYAPSSWQEGSSFSHFDEASYPAGSVGALMTPSLGSQETARILDAATLGVLSRTGWPMRVKATTPTISSASAISGQVTVSWVPQLAQVGLAPDSYRIEARVGATVHGSQTVSGAATSATVPGLSSGTTYTVAVIPVAKGLDGVAATASVATPAVVGSPRAVAATGSGTNRTVTWLPAAGSGANSYEVQSSRNGGGWTAAGSTTGLSVNVALSEAVYQFRVRGANNQGAGSWGYSIPTGIAAGVVRPVPLDGQISRLYQAYFLRAPDDVGFAYWRDARASGAGLGAISDAFAGSGEFVAAYGSLSNAQFVDLVYQNVLDRAPDAVGRGHWIGQLNGGLSRGAVMTGFSDSSEFVAKTNTADPQSAVVAEVYRLYVAFFLRTPDAAGLDYWVGVRSGGGSTQDVSVAFAASTEFQARYGSLANAAFVELVYNNVLARQPDAVGNSYWQSLLASGVDRGSMMIGFSESHEFILATGTVP